MVLEAETVGFISQLGFPIAVTVYLLITRDRIIIANTEAIQQLREVLFQMKK